MNESPAISETPPTTPAPASRSALMIVFLVVFIDLLGFGIVLPLLPVIGDDYISKVVGAGVWNGVTIGLLMASFSLIFLWYVIETAQFSHSIFSPQLRHITTVE